ncbi:MAG: MurR/RpiR family transcriptional regulator [Gammaproteobacteria bacterium]|nr:MurR/RpiR family transcriptional regulator [Gammaproteobacteria bacterium]
MTKILSNQYSVHPPAKGEIPSAPKTLPELRSIALTIARGETTTLLGPKASRALAQILELQGSPALLSITALADKLAVNPSTLTRLARSLGYPGFGAFQQVLLDASMTSPGAFYSQHAQVALEGGGVNSRTDLAKLCRENQANIDRFLQLCDMHQFTYAIDLIVSAKRVSVYGIRQFHAFASFLVYGLRMIRSDVHLLDANALGVAEGLAAMEQGDVLITASCSPYSTGVVEASKVAHERGINVIAITDWASSPLVGVSNSALLVPHDSSFISNSLTTFILLAECLINGCAAQQPNSSKKALAERENLIDKLGIEM